MTGEQRPWRGPQPTLTDGVVTLRPWRDADSDAVHAACQDEQIQQWTTVPSPYQLTDAEEFIQSAQESWDAGTEAPFAVVSAADGTLVGSCGLVRVDQREQVGEVGYWVAPWARRRGYLTRALAVLEAWAGESTDLATLAALVEEANSASMRSARAAGFSLTDQIRFLPLHGDLRPFAVLTRTIVR